MSDHPTGNGIPPKPTPEAARPRPIEYPIQYVFKIMGAAAQDFEVHAVALVARVIGPVPAERVVIQPNPAGRYVSVSVSVMLLSEDQRRAVYQVLWEDERVLYYL